MSNVQIKTYIKSENLPSGNPYGITPYKKVSKNSKEFKMLSNMIMGVNREKRSSAIAPRVDI